MTDTIAHCIVPVFFALLALLFPYKSRLNSSSGNFVILKRKYQKWETFAIVPIALFMTSMTYGLGHLFIYLADQTNKSITSIFQLMPADFTWFIPAGLISFGLIVIPMSLLYRAILGDEGYEDYLTFTNIKHGFDGLKIMRPIFVLMVLCGATALFLLNDYSISLHQNKIEINPFFSTKIKEIKYDEIKAIHFVFNKEDKENKLIPFPHYVVVFDNDTKWIADGDHDLKTTDDKKLINYLREQAPNKIDTLAVY